MSEQYSYTPNKHLHPVVNKFLYSPRFGLMGGIRFTGVDNIPQDEPFSLVLPKRSRLNVHAATHNLGKLEDVGLYFLDDSPENICSLQPFVKEIGRTAANRLIIPTGIAGTGQRLKGPVHVHYGEALGFRDISTPLNAYEVIRGAFEKAQITAEEHRGDLMATNASARLANELSPQLELQSPYEVARIVA